MHGLSATSKIVRGQRQCMHCGYGLTGQAVLRDDRYDLLLARCPECGRLACFEQEPLLGRRARILCVVLGGLLVGVLVFTWWLGGYAMAGFTRGTAHVAASDYIRQLNDRYRAFEAEVAPASEKDNATPPTPPGVQVVVTRPTFGTWWKDRDEAAMLAAAGGRLGAINSAVLIMLVPMGLASLSIGAFWSVVLFRLHGIRRLAIALVLIAPTVAIVATDVLAWLAVEEMRWAGDVARRELGPMAVTSALAFQLVVIAVGLGLGRRIARGVVRLTIPPRHRGFVAQLWFTDGLEPELEKAFVISHQPSAIREGEACAVRPDAVRPSLPDG